MHPVTRKQRYCWCAALVIVLVWSCCGCKLEEKRQSVKVGYLLCNSEQETRERFTPLTRYLSAKTGVEFIMVPVELHDLEQRFAAGEFAFVRTNSLLYTILKESSGARLLAAEKRGNFGARTAGTIIARKGSGIRGLADLQGKSLAFGAMLAPAGYLAEYDLLLAAGVDPEKDLGHYTTPRGSFKHEKLVYGVLFGAYDAAAVPLLDLETMTREGKIATDDFMILARSGTIPYCTFAAAKGVEQSLVTKVRKALTALQPEDTAVVDGETVRVMKAARVDGYEELADSDFDPVRAMAKRVNGHQQLQ
jgi:phosphonate transport system substrate-binding protein